MTYAPLKPNGSPYPSSQEHRYQAAATPSAAASSSYSNYLPPHSYGNGANYTSNYSPVAYPNGNSSAYVAYPPPSTLPPASQPIQYSPQNSQYDQSYSSSLSSSPPQPAYPASPSRPYPCDMCALSFDRSHDLKRHRDSHSGVKPFICGSCNKTFSRKDALRRHQSQKQCGI